jgi:hypothetical protein
MFSAHIDYSHYLPRPKRYKPIKHKVTDNIILTAASIGTHETLLKNSGVLVSFTHCSYFVKKIGIRIIINTIKMVMTVVNSFE